MLKCCQKHVWLWEAVTHLIFIKNAPEKIYRYLRCISFKKIKSDLGYHGPQACRWAQNAYENLAKFTIISPVNSQLFRQVSNNNHIYRYFTHIDKLSIPCNYLGLKPFSAVNNTNQGELQIPFVSSNFLFGCALCICMHKCAHTWGLPPTKSFRVQLPITSKVMAYYVFWYKTPYIPNAKSMQNI